MRSTLLLGLAHAVLSSALLALDVIALAHLPAGSVGLNVHPEVAQAPVLFVVLPLVWLAAAPSLPDRSLQTSCALILAGGSSNLLAMSLFGGVPDYLVLRHGLSLADRSAWQAGVAVFNAGDVAIVLGIGCLLLLALSAHWTGAETVGPRGLTADRRTARS